ncbi:MAG TPA: CPBP family intramembrane glutamic endopeptidase [Patescibacteria group bacterium]|nr:CPBP family intramembrane glutamic endopeptidase [Patescibacteria group bacterium]
MNKYSEFKFTSRTTQGLLLFVLTLIVFNIAFISSNGWARLFWNISGYAILFMVYKFTRLSLDSIGLSRRSIKPGLKYGCYIVLVILFVMLVAFFIDKTIYKDPRYHRNLSTALYSVLILLPLKTVIFEEIAFRGILPAILLKIRNERRFAAIVASLAFGLWHVFSATKIGNYHIGGNVNIPGIAVIGGVFIATSLFGYLLCELRLRSNSLVAPIIVHWFLNGFGIVLASLSWL